MRTIGGQELPARLKKQIESRIKCGVHDPRARPSYRLPASAVQNAVTENNFCNGMFSAVNWEQVARLQQIWAMRNARESLGPRALQNTREGKPKWLWNTFCPYLCRQATRLADIFARVIGRKMGQPGQLVCFAQRVDRPQVQQFASDVVLMRKALEIVNMTDTGKLSGLCSMYIGMPMKVTTKVLPPDIVQEATAEVLGISFHEEECYGMPRRPDPPGSWPPPNHPCWQRGWVLLDRLPRCVELRMHGEYEDYTGTGRPGVYLMEPKNADWDFKYQAQKIINHPNAKPVVQKAAKTVVSMRSSQLPLGPAGVGTFNNFQGKTVKDELGVPMGHTIDLKLMQKDDENWAHYYMILGRATSLSTTMLLNFPTTEDGEYDWSMFERGPPEYMAHVFQGLQNRYKKTVRLVEKKQRQLKIFPAFEQIPKLKQLGNGRFEYAPEAWDKAAGCRGKRPSEALTEGMGLAQRLDERRQQQQPPRRRLRSKCAGKDPEEIAEVEAKKGTRTEAQEKAKNAAEEHARTVAEEKTKKKAEGTAKTEAEEKVKKEILEKAKKVVEEKAKKEAEEKATQEAEEAKNAAEEHARTVAEEKAKKKAEGIAKTEAQEKVNKEILEKAKKVEEEKAKKEAEEKATQEAEEQAREQGPRPARNERPEAPSWRPCCNCGHVRCSTERCCACDTQGCNVMLPTCPYYKFDHRVEHSDGAYGDFAPHMTQTAVHCEGNVVWIDARKHKRGFASGEGCNCLIFSLAGVLGVGRPDASTIRNVLRSQFTSGPALVQENNYLIAEFHWRAIVQALGQDPLQYRLTVVSLGQTDHGSVHGAGVQNLAIGDIGNYHFIPLMPAEGPSLHACRTCKCFFLYFYASTIRDTRVMLFTAHHMIHFSLPWEVWTFERRLDRGMMFLETCLVLAAHVLELSVR